MESYLQLQSAFGNEIKISVPPEIKVPDCVAFMINGQGFVFNKEELEKFKAFLCNL